LPRECTELPGEPPMPLVEMLLGARAREVLRCEALGIERTDRDPETMETFEQRGGPPDAFWALQRTGVDRPRAAQMLRDEHACGFVARDDARRDLERGGLGGDPRFVDEIERARAIRAREANHPLMLAARGKERASSQASGKRLKSESIGGRLVGRVGEPDLPHRGDQRGASRIVNRLHCPPQPQYDWCAIHGSMP